MLFNLIFINNMRFYIMKKILIVTLLSFALFANYASSQTIPAPCDPDMSDCKLPWSGLMMLTYNISPDCLVIVFYVVRACTFNEVQILKIESYGSGCSSFPPAFLIQESFQQITNLNQMGYRPTQPGDCYDYWLFSIASCWVTFYCHGFCTPSPEPYEVLLPCNGTDCCAQQYRVCRINQAYASINPIGGVIAPNECEESEMPDTPPELEGLVDSTSSCLPYCDALNFTTGEVTRKGIYDNDEQVQSCYILGNDGLLLLNVTTKEPKYLSVNIVDLNGQLVKGINLNEVNGTIQKDIDLSQYAFGFYLINIYENNILLKTYKLLLKY